MVPQQFEPDGRFPTVAFPNPEEPGALDLATELATQTGADLIIANDPDTDRLAVSVEHPDGWRPLTGNQIGVLLADFVLEHTAEAHPIVLNSIVSSPLLSRIAAAHGARFAQTLTGFKWIWNAALDLQEAGEGRFVFGYEEALGYSVGQTVRDKDGISAAVLFADLAAACRAAGGTVLDRLADLSRRHGLWVSTQHSVVRPGTEGAAEIAAAMERLAADPPASLDGIPVVSVTDFRRGAEERPRYLPAASLVEMDLGERGRVLARPSGTEPKLKIYVDVTAAVASGEEPGRMEGELRATADRLAAATVSVLDL
jgi:phosphomannomutase